MRPNTETDDALSRWRRARVRLCGPLVSRKYAMLAIKASQDYLWRT